jgi:tetratricopeptide (TPR) repeat protein
MAHASIASFHYFYGEHGIDRAAGDRSIGLAMAHSDRLTERERLAHMATDAQAHGRTDEALARSRELATRFPDRDTWYNLGTNLMRRAQWREAIDPLRRSVALDPRFFSGWINLATTYQGGDQLDSAVIAYREAERADSERIRGGGNVNQEWGGAHLRLGRPLTAESIFRRAAESGPAENRTLGLRSVAWLASYRGRYREAARLLEQAASVADEAQQQLSAARNRWLLAWVRHQLGDDRGARVALERARSTLGDLPTDPVFLVHLASAHLAAGAVADARRLEERVARTIRPANRQERSLAGLLRGMLALEQGRADSAISEARRFDAEQKDYRGLRDLLLATGYERLGRLDSALAAATRSDSLWQFGYEAQFRWRHTPLLIGRLALRLGDTVRARAALERQLEAWKDADADFPDLVEARRLLEGIRRARP